MLVLQIELEEVAMVETSDIALEAAAGAIGAFSSTMVATYCAGYGAC